LNGTQKETGLIKTLPKNRKAGLTQGLLQFLGRLLRIGVKKVGFKHFFHRDLER